MLRYNPPSSIRNFGCIQKVAIWAGFFGIAQALCWMALTITGILSYSCVVHDYSDVTFGNLISHTLLRLYFRGNCDTGFYTEYDYQILEEVPTILGYQDVFIWECVYLGVVVLWFLSSILIITNLNKDNKSGTGSILLAWVLITLSICVMDLALGIIFGIDFSNFHDKALASNFNSAEAGFVNANNAQYLAGSIAAIAMMLVALKGFVLWIINFSFVIYLGFKALTLLNDSDANDNLFITRKDSDDILSTRSPINAYEDQKMSTSFTNEAFLPDNRSMTTLELNEDALARAARISRDVTLQERRFRNLDAFQQYPPPRANNSKQVSDNQSNSMTTSSFPAPDYSPPMSRSNQSQNGAIRNQRY